MLEKQAGMISWKDNISGNPLKGRAWNVLVKNGFSPLFARTVAEKIPDFLTEETMLSWLEKVLIKNAKVRQPGEDFISKGGVRALVGPTGVGKTTTTAKLAARCVAQFGAKSLGLITMDNFRIGAQDQLRIYGKIMGVDVYVAQNAQDLFDLRSVMAGKHLVLVDTIGMAQRDIRVVEQAKLMGSCEVHRTLVLNAASQPETLEDVTRNFKQGGLDSLILTKLDEAVRLGGVLDTLIRHKIPVEFFATGQRVPEDLFPADMNILVRKALTAKASSVFEMTADEEVLSFNRGFYS
jgi:flagellar biosynthesis protein FlhF